ncbi:MAG: hypothetical protein K1X89_19110 [Myxococcaceae bacterium]|nr:hypothetical protein [Myxococcaceae bacterium]
MQYKGPGGAQAVLTVVLAVALAAADGGVGAEALGLTDAGTLPTDGWRLELEGNRAVPEEVYRLILGTDELFHGSPAQAQQRTEAFLKRAGFELATVVATTEGGTLTLHVDEGRLNKLVVRGPLTLPRLRMRILLTADREAFNRPQLERRLDQLVEEVGGPRPRLELVEVSVPHHVGPQLDTSILPEAEVLLGGRRRYELHLVFPDDEWPRGLALDVRVGYYDGLELGLRQQGQGLLFGQDRWRAQASVGLGVRRELVTKAPYFAFSRAFMEAFWATPPVGPVRVDVSVEGEALGRQRPDLALENYQAFTGVARMGVTWNFQPTSRLSLVGGARLRAIRGLVDQAGNEVAAPDQPPLRGFIGGEFLWVVSMDPLRSDRGQEVGAQVRRYLDSFDLRGPGVGEVRAWWRLLIPLGWHDLIFQARGAWLWGDVVFHDEEPIAGLHLREAPGAPWSRAAGSGSAEFRFSLVRDFFKVGAFVDMAGYGEINRELGTVKPRFGAAVGPGLHVLAADIFQIDGYVAVGFLSNGQKSVGVQLRLLKVF